MEGCPRVLKDKRRQGAHNQPYTHAGNLDLSVAGTCTHEHGYDLAGSLLFSGNHGLADPFLFLWREKSFPVDHLTNSPRLRRLPNLPPPRSTPPPPPRTPHPPRARRLRNRLRRNLREKPRLPNLLLVGILIYRPTDFPQSLYLQQRLWLLAGLQQLEREAKQIQALLR